MIGNKSVLEALKAAGMANQTAHFSALRGKNEWEHYQQVIMVGREMPSIQSIENYARAFASDDPEPFESITKWKKEKRGLRMRDQSSQYVEVDRHPNPYAELVLRQIRDGEAMQGIDRVRPMFLSEKTPEPVKITLLSSLALDVTVDRVEPWLDAKRGGDKAIQALDINDVLPLSARDAFNLHPELWASKSTAERDLKEPTEYVKSLVSQNPYIYTIWKVGH